MSSPAPSIPVTFAEFKQMGGEFFRALPTLNMQEANNAFKCLSLAYLGMDGTDGEMYQAAMVINIAGLKMIEAESARAA